MKVLVLVCVITVIGIEGTSASDSRCKFYTGDGKGGTYVQIGYLTRKDCINACIERKREHDDSINGVTVYANKPGCWCNSGMTYRDDSNKYASCFLGVPDPNPTVQCALYYGDGKGGDNDYIGDLSWRECIDGCIKRKNEIDDSINGATVYANSKSEGGCYCEKGMTYRDTDKKWKSCLLKVPDVNADKKCALFSGDGKGGSDIWVGYLNRSECFDECIKRKADEDDLINGMTVYSNPDKKGCYCEKGMKWRKTKTVFSYESCFLRVPDPNADKKCELNYGDGEGGMNTWIGYLTRRKCIEACFQMKQLLDDSINGVTVDANEATKGCFCEKAMTYRDKGKKWKSCILRQPEPEDPCKKNNGGCEQLCTNKNGIAQCTCNSGYDAESNKCNDIDECVSGTSACSQGCVNTKGLYKCECFSGYKFDKDGKTCVDIDECDSGMATCNQSCVNTKGSYECVCLSGYKLDKDGKTCVVAKRCNGVDNGCCTAEKPCLLGDGDCDHDNECAPGLVCGDNNCPWGDADDCCTQPPVDPCKKDNGGCEQLCINKNGVAQCSCSSGYKPESSKCNDIDECVSGTSTCSQSCVNTKGSYKCECLSGYKFAKDGKTCVDIDECVSGTSACSQNCVNTEGSYKCKCLSGYKLAKDRKTCLDIDECVSGTSACSQNCVNTEGSYKCECFSGYKLAKDGKTCVAPVEPCKIDNGDCEQVCTNKNGVAQCSCSSGYKPESSKCNDIDECVSGTSACSQNCVNTEGSYKCECFSGNKLAKDGKTCIDIDECVSSTSACSQSCVNTNGSYRCECFSGYKLDKDGKTCVDIDECGSGKSACSQNCVNTEGSYKCECFSGYTLAKDEKTCVDIDECVSGSSACSQNCVNTKGSYKCECFSGYKLAKDGKTCVDLDECVSGTSACSQHCVNTKGSYKCECFSGYKAAKDGKTCEDIDECVSSTSACSQSCVNTNGLYRCECFSGYKLDKDGKTCVDVDAKFKYLGKKYCATNMYTFTNGHEKCDGWSGVTLDECEQSCLKNEAAPACPRKTCEYVIYFPKTSRCHHGAAECKVAEKSTALLFERKGQCPASHPYTYYQGKYCCLTSKENVYAAQGNACDGGKISLDSLCCEGDQGVRCPHGNCVNHEQCPASHPYAYYHGKYCCLTSKENVYAPQGEGCDGGKISRDSLCCEGDQGVRCPQGNCANHASKRCNGIDDGCCTVENPCYAGDGDCDNDNECASGSYCGTNNCPWGGNDDCCAATKRCNGINNGCCTAETPCDVGDGDCDYDNECASGLFCGTNNCPWGGKDDCCAAPADPCKIDNGGCEQLCTNKNGVAQCSCSSGYKAEGSKCNARAIWSKGNDEIRYSLEISSN